MDSKRDFALREQDLHSPPTNKGKRSYLMKNHLRYIYGPVYSWRLGRSLGIDPISIEDKICNFDCIYCQLGDTVNLENERKIFVPTAEIIEEVNSLRRIEIDYLTFSGRGEPTLAKNLGEMICSLREIRKEKIAVITNSALMNRRDVRDDLMLADYVLAKLDACSPDAFKVINRPASYLQFNAIVDGIGDFKTIFKGKLALQIMFVEQNIKYANDIVRIVKRINPDEIQINTPLRKSSTQPLTEEELNGVKKYFKGLPVITVYEMKKEEVKPIDVNSTMKRHGDCRILKS